MIISGFDATRDKAVVDFVNRNLFGKNVLELGCGGGERSKLFYNVCHVTGVDIVNRVSLENRNKFIFTLSDATNLPFADEAFDAVVSFDVIEHVEADDQFVREAFRVCKKGGFLVLGTPNRLRLSNRLLALVGKPVKYPYYLGPDTIHLREYTREQFDCICSNNGLVGCCLSIWVGLVGKIHFGLATFPSFLAPISQYLLFVGNRPQ